MDKLAFDESVFISTLKQIIQHAEKVQNKPPTLIPNEELIANEVLSILGPYSTEKGGPLKIEKICFQEHRANVIIEYKGTDPDQIVSFVGSHMDVVPADPKTWNKNPFEMTVSKEEGQTKCWGRGTTDCLGHVALLTEFFRQLAVNKPALKTTVVAVFIASEENSEIPGIGVEELVARGKLDHLKKGPLYWVDCADEQPCVGSGAVIEWALTAHGKLGHSAFPQNSVNALIMAYEACNELMKRFHAKYPTHPNEKKYGFVASSSMKPTMFDQCGTASNQIPSKATIRGDIRVVPFYDALEVKKDIESWIKEINGNVDQLQGHGFSYKSGEFTGSLELEWIGDLYFGVACDMESKGFQALAQASQSVLGEVKPFSVCGSLPCVKELQDAGFDLQMVGYGVEAVYHADNEYCTVEGMKRGFDVFNLLIQNLNK